MLELAGRLNLPNWPAVDIVASGAVISCRSLTWEPLLAVRIEEAIEAWLGHRWTESVGFIQSRPVPSGRSSSDAA